MLTISLRSNAAPFLAIALITLSGCGRAREVASAGAPLTCTGCHGQPPASGAHATHLQGGPLRGPLACDDCHPVPTASSHANSRVDFAFGPLAGPGTAFTNGRCTGSYCHGATLGRGGSSTAPLWTGGAAEAACGSCHGQAPGNPLPPPPHAQGTACGRCHPGFTDSSVDVLVHVNGVPDVRRQHPDPAWAQKDHHGAAALGAPGLLACAACHGDAFDGGDLGISCNACHAAAGHADWRTDCTFCHGTRTGTFTWSANPVEAAPPEDVLGRSDRSAVGVGAHASHLGRGIACATCHVVPPAELPAALDHVQGGRARVQLGGLAAHGVAASYDPATTTCASYCHGATLPGGVNRSPPWTSAGLGCDACHGAPPATGAHLRHASRPPALAGYGDQRLLEDVDPTSLSTNYAFGCGFCHPGAPERHLDGEVTVELTPAEGVAGGLRSRNASDAAYDPGARTCSGVSCHSTGQATPTYVVAPDWLGGPIEAGCFGCHGNPPAYRTGAPGAADANGHLYAESPGNRSWPWGHFGRHEFANHGGVFDYFGRRHDASPLTCQACHYETVDPTNTAPGGFFYLDTTIQTSLPESPSWPTDAHQCQVCHNGSPGTPPAGSGRVRALRHVNGKRDVSFDPRRDVPPGYAAGLVPDDAPVVRPYWFNYSFTNLSVPPPSTPETVYRPNVAIYTTCSFPLTEATYDPATKSCSTVACHFKDSASTTWGGGFPGPNGCGTCH